MKPMISQRPPAERESAHATPTRFLGMTLRVYRTSPAGERAYLPVAESNGSKNGSYPNCSCERCHKTPSARTGSGEMAG
jgi:hypothetical protein